MVLDVGTKAIGLAASTGSAVVAASLLATPISASGAALYGATLWATTTACTWLAGKVIKQETSTDKFGAELCALVAIIFATWKAAEAFGMPIALKSSVALSLATYGIYMAAIVGTTALVACLGLATLAASFGAASSRPYHSISTL